MTEQYYLSENSFGHQATADVMKVFGFEEGSEAESKLIIEHISYEEIVSTKCAFWDRGLWVRREKKRKIDGSDCHFGKEHVARLNTFHLLTEFTGCSPTPWGILKGVRPTKIAHRLLDEGRPEADVLRIFCDEYAVSAAKARLVTDIALRQRSVLTYNNSQKISVYVGIPFCPSRCFYCSFPGMALPQPDAVKNFLTALHADICDASQSIVRHGFEVESIYVGGGTPTSLATADLEQVLVWIEQHLKGPKTKEITVEAGRPDSLNHDKIRLLGAHDVTRVSVNPQSMQQKTLKRIGRNHTIQDIINIFMEFRSVTKCLINMDVIAGLPGETLADMTDTLEKIRQLNPDNLTVHTLSVKRGSNLQSLLVTDPLFTLEDLPEPSVVTRMIDKAASVAASMHMKPYYLYRQKNMVGNLENVGYAKEPHLSYYNIQMMEERQTVIGIGPGATTKAVVDKTHRLKSCYHAKNVVYYQKDLDRYLAKRRTLLERLCAGTLFME
ncbi:oxygen-independent coproporphyrinogen-3 oxidase [Sporomusaceae bacterium BoRhaA]|uniref:coproporphyrinogen dehydrogenase HemZ n=1 Tax=Pelorhabdus rhamnosifermentans TaxID=2772457 RepID=UPI001C05EE26|nr:coproporphyrinogen dehydrogenase HemZ [Pelorhabdus rhamnosifermentans]MBU2700904.1 oxygen-independent coproporphyrinogen-3 oxidase [Pelorhabdus rhamnosifermentans]